MKKIGIDARLYSQTGVGVYIRNLLYNLSLQNHLGLQYYIYCLESEQHTIALPRDTFTIRPVNYKWHTFGEQTGFYRVLMGDNLDLMHFTYFSYPVLYTRPFIATVHDTILLQHKTGKASTGNRLFYELKHLGFRYVFDRQIKNALYVITPTHTVQNQLVSTFGKAYRNKIVTYYEGIDHTLQNTKPSHSPDKKYEKPFFMYVGNFYPHKNVERLVEAFSGVSDTHILVLVGPDDYFSHRISRYIEDKKMEDHVLLRHNVSEKELAYLYTHADALIHPSLDEGFGLPLIEAAYYNLPVIASDIPVFKELLGDTYVSFSPRDVSDIRRAVRSFIEKPFKPSYGDIQKLFSFSKMTADIQKLYVLCTTT